jgi:hypothetical protein
MKTGEVDFDFPVLGISSDNDLWASTTIGN